jgi:hypothetical protein
MMSNVRVHAHLSDCGLVTRAMKRQLKKKSGVVLPRSFADPNSSSRALLTALSVHIP